jgi:hypothetical protein
MSASDPLLEVHLGTCSAVEQLQSLALVSRETANQAVIVLDGRTPNPAALRDADQLPPHAKYGSSVRVSHPSEPVGSTENEVIIPEPGGTWV